MLYFLAGNKNEEYRGVIPVLEEHQRNLRKSNGRNDKIKQFSQ